MCGPYRLQGRLGSGGMGVVYLAFGPDGSSDNAAVALKVLQPMLADDEEYRARFRREVSAARLVDSPYVARVVGAETESSPLWMATEYVEGATLARAIETNGPIPADRLHGLASDLASAVAAMHAVGLVHRDLKPANIVLAWSGPKVIDFGIAKHEGATDLTQAGLAVGSPLWMSPEVLTGSPASRASDVFAWGECVAYAGLGHSPFGDGNPNAVAYRISNETPDLSGLPGGLAELVAASLAKQPEARPTADVICSALGGVERGATSVAIPSPQGGWTGPNAGTTARAYPPTPLPPASPPPPKKRARLLVPLAAVAVLLVAAGVALGLVLSSSEDHSATPPPSPRVSPSHSATPRPTGSPGPSPSLMPLTPGFASVDNAEAIVMADGYTPDPNSAASWDPQAPINVIIGTLTGSADGYNTWAFFFNVDEYIGHDTKDPSLAVSISSRTSTVITLSYVIYQPSDPNCCPTGGTRNVRFQWNGTQLVPLDPIPSTDPSGPHR